MSITMDVDRVIADADRELPALYQLFAGYFHEDWQEEFETPDAVVRGFAGDAPASAVRAAISELDRLLGAGLDEPGLARLLADGLDCDYIPQSDGLTASAWLSRVQRILSDSRRD
jgi:CdiI immunity protein